LDAVFFHTQVTSLFSAGIMRQVPSLISLDATPINYDSLGEHYGHRPAGDGLLDRQKFRLNQRAFHAADGLVTWSEWARRSLVHDYGVPVDRVRVLAPGASAAYFAIGRARRETTSSSPSARLRLLFVGADFYRKGGSLVMQLMRGRLARHCELHIVTQSDVPSDENVTVHRGLQANSPVLLELFAHADVFVLPTYADCLGLVLMEASAAGLPVVTTPVGGVAEVVNDGESGLLVPVGDAQALEAALLDLASAPDRRRRMGEATHALARTRFDAERNNRALLDFLQELALARPAMRRAA
jgi:glycosyltransferase involved in cell wall biosynthesis